jgi:hypothetical protein
LAPGTLTSFDRHAALLQHARDGLRVALNIVAVARDVGDGEQREELVDDRPLVLLPPLEEAYRRIEVLQTTIYNIHLLAGEKFETAESAGLFVNDVVEHIGFSETVMNVLEAADGPLSVPEIKQRLEEGGRDLRKYTNVRSTIHTVARRLVISGRVREVFRDGRRFEAVRSDEAAVTEKPEPQPKSPVHRKKVSTLARGRAGSPK